MSPIPMLYKPPTYTHADYVALDARMRRWRRLALIAAGTLSLLSATVMIESHRRLNRIALDYETALTAEMQQWVRSAALTVPER